MAANGQTSRLPMGLFVAAFACFVVLEYARRYPPAGILPDAALFVPLAPTKLVAWLGLGARLVAINACAIAIGLGVTRLLGSPPGPPRTRTLLQLGMGLLVLPYGVLALAAVHALVLPAFLALLFVPIALAAPALLRAVRAMRWRPPTLAGVGLGIGFGLLLLDPALALFDFAPGWDALTYHLALPERSLRANGIVVTPLVWASAFPANAEMLYLLALGIGDATLARALHFEFGILTLLALHQLGRQLSPRVAWLAPLLLLADPLFRRELSFAYNDLVVAFYLAACVLLLAQTRVREGLGARGLLWCGLFAGACLATRYTGVAVLLSVWTVLLWQAPGRGVRERLRDGVLVGAAAALPLLPWLVRNLVFTGNPVAPALQSLFHAAGHEFFHPLAVAQNTELVSRIGMGKGLAPFLLGPWNLTMETIPELYTQSFGFLIGPLHLVGVVGALLLRDVRRTPLVSMVLKLSLAFYVFWFFTFQEVRYLLPLLPLTTWLAAIVFDRILPGSDRGLRSRAAALLWAIPVLALVLGGLRTVDQIGARWALALGALEAPERLYPDPAWEAADWLRQHLGPEHRVLLLYESRGFLFRELDYLPFFTAEASPVQQWIHEASTPAALRCRLEALGVTHVLVNRRLRQRAAKIFVPGWDREALRGDDRLLDAFLADWADLLHRTGDVRIGRLRPAGAACAGARPPAGNPA